MPDSLNIPCPACGQLNRVEQSKLGDNPVCAKCRQPIMPAHPVELDGPGLERQIAKSPFPLLVDFWAPWCGPCKTMGPAFAEAAETLQPRVRLAKLNTEAHQQPGSALGIRSIPTMVLFKDGREAARVSGAMSAQQIVQWVNSQA